MFFSFKNWEAYRIHLNKAMIGSIWWFSKNRSKSCTVTYLYNNNHKIYNAITFIEFLSYLNDDDLIVILNEDYLRRKLNDLLHKLVSHPRNYSYRSFIMNRATF